MSFSERMKDLLDQGLVASKEIAAKAQELGERGMLMLEIKQLEGQAQKVLTRLGNEAYIAFEERKQQSINCDEPAVKAILTELYAIREIIENKEVDLKNRKAT